MASPSVCMWALGLLARGMERRPEAHRSRPHGSRMGNVHRDRRQGRSAVEWSPLGVPRLPPSTDLPQFVEHISDVNFKLGLRGTIRMERQCSIFILRAT